MWDVRETEDVHRGIWWGNLKEKKTLGKRRRKWEDIIKMDLQAVRWVHGID